MKNDCNIQDSTVCIIFCRYPTYCVRGMSIMPADYGAQLFDQASHHQHIFAINHATILLVPVVTTVDWQVLLRSTIWSLVMHSLLDHTAALLFDGNN